MPNKVHVKVNDFVYVRTGKDRAQTGKVKAVYPKTNRVVVEGVNMVTKHNKPSAKNQAGGITHQEGSINASNVMLICPNCKKPSKTGRRYLENGTKVRFCKACDGEIDVIREKKG